VIEVPPSPPVMEPAAFTVEPAPDVEAVPEPEVAPDVEAVPDVEPRPTTVPVMAAAKSHESFGDEEADPTVVRRQIAAARRNMDPDHQIRRAMDAFLSPTRPNGDGN
jgi:hypothetical protein